MFAIFLLFAVALAQTAEPTPSPTSAVTTSGTPDVTPSPSVDPSADPTPESTPSPTTIFDVLASTSPTSSRSPTPSLTPSASNTPSETPSTSVLPSDAPDESIYLFQFLFTADNFTCEDWTQSYLNKLLLDIRIADDIFELDDCEIFSDGVYIGKALTISPITAEDAWSISVLLQRSRLFLDKSGLIILQESYDSSTSSRLLLGCVASTILFLLA